jgi:hypothetical protein
MTQQPWYALNVRPSSEMLVMLEGVQGVLVRESSSNSFAVSVQILQRFVSLSIDQCVIETV